MDLMLKGRTAVVTGGGKGIGAGISKCLAAEGVNVVINYNSNPQMAEETAGYIKELGGNAITVGADVSEREQVDHLIQQAISEFGGIDILVNNAAWQPNFDIYEYTEDSFDRIMNINLGGYFRCMQAALPYLKESECPRIINISSIHAKRPSDFDVCYSMAKGAVKMLTREAAVEFIDYGITVNAILPGGVRIEFKSGYNQRPKGVRVKRERKYRGLYKRGNPEDVGVMVAYLASEKSYLTTGSSLRMDGGRMVR